MSAVPVPSRAAVLPSSNLEAAAQAPAVAAVARVAAVAAAGAAAVAATGAALELLSSNLEEGSAWRSGSSFVSAETH